MGAWLQIGKRTVRGLGLALTCALCAAAPSARFDAAVVKVVDGDSLWLRPAGADQAVEVRVQDIDAPEICQPWGRQAREALAERVAGRTLVVQPRGRDTHGRLLALISIGGENLGAWMVGEGHAWSIRTRWDRGPLVKEERMASALRRGLWTEPNPVEPRAFRRQHGPCVAGETGVPATTPAPAPVATMPSPARPTAAWRCDGRTRCHQMTSCAEATYFLRHCPQVEMDGDRDGIPCEDQWCR